MNEYQKLLAFLKITGENLKILHHNLVGGDWFANHEQLGEYYEKIAEIADEATERGLSLGYKEPTISEAVLLFQSDILPAMDRDTRESFAVVSAAFRSIAGMMSAAKAITPPDVQNKLDEWIYSFNFEADYKLARLLGKTPEATAEEEWDD